MKSVKKILAIVLFVCLMFTLTGCGGGSSRRTCPSCGKSVTSLTTKKDIAGVSRTWCSSCWADYRSIIGY